MYTSTLPCHLRTLWHKRPVITRLTPLSSSFNTGHVLEVGCRLDRFHTLPALFSVCVEWAALCMPWPRTVMVCLPNKVYFHYCSRLVRDWGLYVQRKPQAISSSERLIKPSWFLDLPTYKLAGVTQTNPCDIAFSLVQQSMHWHWSQKGNAMLFKNFSVLLMYHMLCSKKYGTYVLPSYQLYSLACEEKSFDETWEQH